MQRLGKNIGGYGGECIEIQELLENVKAAALEKNWLHDSFSIPNGAQLIAYRRKAPQSQRRLYISTGIHGDEPAGPLSVHQLICADEWPAHVDIWLCPCLNLTGFPLNKRENAQGIDLNRDYRHLKSPETRTHAAWLQQQPNFDVATCLHEDWEASGFYLYELNPDNRPSLAQTIIKEVAKVCPIEASDTVDGWKVRNGVVRPNVAPAERPQWPESLFLITTKTRQSYTLEAPSDFSLNIRVNALVTAVRAILSSL